MSGVKFSETEVVVQHNIVKMIVTGKNSGSLFEQSGGYKIIVNCTDKDIYGPEYQDWYDNHGGDNGSGTALEADGTELGINNPYIKGLLIQRYPGGDKTKITQKFTEKSLLTAAEASLTASGKYKVVAVINGQKQWKLV